MVAQDFNNSPLSINWEFPVQHFVLLKGIFSDKQKILSQAKF